MTLKEAEDDPRFQSFKFMGMLELYSYIGKCEAYLTGQNDDEVKEFMEAAKLICDSRNGVDFNKAIMENSGAKVLS